MRLARILLAAAATGAALPPATARGAAYGTYEQGAAVLGMAGAGTASVHDASAVFFNPAALAGLAGTRLSAGGTVLQPFTSFAGVAPHPGFGVTEEMETGMRFPPAVYLTHRYEGVWALGLGLNSPFGLDVEWKDPEQFTGRYIITRAELNTLNGSLVAARDLRHGLSIGFGGNLVLARFRLANRRFMPAPGGGGGQLEIANVDLGFDRTPGYGWNAGLLWTPFRSLMVGANYRSRVILHVDGDADITPIPTGNAAWDAAAAAQLPPDQRVSTVLRLPSIAAVGVAWNWGSAVTIEGDAVFTAWSTFRDIPIRYLGTPASNERIVEEYDDAFQIRGGIEHRLAAFTWRLGYFFDQAAAPTESVSPLLPDADRQGATFGLGLGFGGQKRLTLDLYELAVFAQNRKTEGVNRDGFEGEYKTFTNAAGLSVAYHW